MPHNRRQTESKFDASRKIFAASGLKTKARLLCFKFPFLLLVGDAGKFTNQHGRNKPLQKADSYQNCGRCRIGNYICVMFAPLPTPSSILVYNISRLPGWEKTPTTKKVEARICRCTVKREFEKFHHTWRKIDP